MEAVLRLVNYSFQLREPLQQNQFAVLLNLHLFELHFGRFNAGPVYQDGSYVE